MFETNIFDFINSSASECMTLYFTTLLHLLACRATCDGKKLDRQLISLAPGYRTAISSCPESIVFQRLPVQYKVRNFTDSWQCQICEILRVKPCDLWIVIDHASFNGNCTLSKLLPSESEGLVTGQIGTQFGEFLQKRGPI